MSEDETKDTQPLVKDILEEMRNGFAQLREEMRAGFDRIEKELVLINKKINTLNNQMLHITAQYDTLEERVTKLEGSSGIQ